MKTDFNHLSDMAQSYFAIILGWITQMSLMNIGAAILLAARLVVDVPPAYKMLKKYLKKRFKEKKND